MRMLLWKAQFLVKKFSSSFEMSSNRKVKV